jgi:hypothetical protein
MRRFVLSLGLVWALIYIANHTLFMRPSSDAEVDVAASTNHASADRRINSWGAYLPHVRQPLPDNPAVSPSQTRQPRGLVALQIETDATAAAPNEETSGAGTKARSEPSNDASHDRLESRPVLKKSGTASRKAKSPRPAKVRAPSAQASVQTWDAPVRPRQGVGLFVFAPPGF